MGKLTASEIEARMEAYEQAAMALEGLWFDTEEEWRAGIIVAKQIRSIAEKWYSDRADRETDS